MYLPKSILKIAQETTSKNELTQRKKKLTINAQIARQREDN